MFTSMLLILWVSIMTVMLFQKSPDQERTITSSTSSTSPSSLESTISDVFSLDHHHHHYSNNYNNCNNGQQQEVSWHAIVFLFYALWFCVFIFGAALIFWLEHNCTRQDWRKHKTRRLEYIESLLQRKVRKENVEFCVRWSTCDSGIFIYFYRNYSVPHHQNHPCHHPKRPPSV